MVRSHARRSGISSVDDLESESVSTDQERIEGTTDITINVPSDAATFEDAVLLASEYTINRGDVEVIVNVESGHVIETAASLFNGDYSKIKIQSEDATVTAGTGFPDAPLLYVDNGRPPVVDTLIDLNGENGTSAGLSIQNGTGLVATQTNGVINSAGVGLQIRKGNYSVPNTNFSGAGDIGCWLAISGQLNAQDADFSGAGGDAVQCSRGSVGHFKGADLSNPGNKGAQVRRSWGVFEDAIITGASDTGIQAQFGSWISADGVDVSGAGVGIEVNRGSHVAAQDVTANQCFRGLYCRKGATADVSGGTFNDAGNNAVRVDYGGHVAANGVSIDNATDAAANCRGGGQLSLIDANFSNLQSDALLTLRGNIVNVNFATVDGNTIATGDTNVSSFNSITSEGIVFQ